VTRGKDPKGHISNGYLIYYTVNGSLVDLSNGYLMHIRYGKRKFDNKRIPDVLYGKRKFELDGYSLANQNVCEIKYDAV
jgi:hypothetical protein